MHGRDDCERVIVPSPINAQLLRQGLTTAPGPGNLERELIDDVDALDAREALSDALVERGDPRGEYLRLALQLEGLRSWHDGYDEVRQALDTLQARYGLEWSKQVRRVPALDRNEPRWGGTPFGFRRGAVEILRGEAAAVVQNLEASVAHAPICEISVEVDRQSLDQLGQSPALSRVRRLGLRLAARTPADRELTNESLLAFFRSKPLQRLDELEIRGATNLPQLARVLADTPGLHHLRSLTLEAGHHSPPIPGAALDADSLQALIRSPVLQGLQELSLRGHQLGRPGVELLWGVRGLRSLELQDDSAPHLLTVAGESCLDSLEHLTLSLGSNGKGLSGLKNPGLRQLRSLSLGASGLSAKRLPAVLEAWDMPELRELSIPGNPLREGGAQALAASRAFEKLRVLDVSSCYLGDAGMAALSSAENFKSLERLDVASNSLKKDGLQALAHGPLLQRVRHLSVRNNKCQNAGGFALAESPYLRQLKSLSLFYNWMGVKALRAIVDKLEAAEALSFDENNYTTEPARALAQSSQIHNLRYFSTRDNDSKWLQALAESSSGQKLERVRLSSSSLDEAAARALAQLPSLGELNLSFCSLGPGARSVLRERLGPFLTFWPPSAADDD